MKKVILLTISILYLLQFSISLAQTGQLLEDKSIKEIKKDIEQLHVDRNILNNKFTVLTQNNNFVSFLVKNEYFRTDITRIELNAIEKLITNYNKNYIKINDLLSEKAKELKNIDEEKTQLLSLKKNLYQSLIEYIRPSYYKEYLDFIESDAKIIKEDIEVKGKLISNKELLTSKVSLIEEKIQIGREHMSSQLKESISIKIDEKITLISDNEKFKSLSAELQIKVIQKTILKVELLIKKMEDDINNESILSQKLEIYEILLQKLSDYNQTLITKKEGE